MGAEAGIQRGNAICHLSIGTLLHYSTPLALQVSTLVVVEHKGGQVAGPTLNTLTAAGQLGGDVTALVGGCEVQGVAEQTSKLPGVSKVRSIVMFKGGQGQGHFPG